MKTAFAYWENRIAPVFDVARRIQIVESKNGRIIGESEDIVPEGLALRKAFHLEQLGIEVLVCGAISRPLHDQVTANGIQVIPFVSGNLGDVILAWLEGRLDNDGFAMPGCCRRSRRNRPKPCCMNQLKKTHQS